MKNAVVTLVRLHFRNSLRPAGPLFYFLIIALCVMQPYHSGNPLESTAGDLFCHISGVIEAGNAFREGQFPLRVAPRTWDGTRYPFFSYYGNLPYSLAGAIYRFGIDPYLAFKLVLLGLITLGGWHTFRCVRQLTRRVGPAIVAGTAFSTAPYMFTDVHARTAFPETIAFNLLPIVLFYNLRTFSRGRLGDMIGAALAWAALSLSHNIGYLYGSTFVCFFLLMLASPRLKYVKRMARVGISFAVGLSLVAWYVLPQMSSVSNLVISPGKPAAPPVGAEFPALDILLWPILKTPSTSTTPNLGLQVGWPSLAGLGLTLLALVFQRRARLRARIAMGLAILFVANVIAVWSPAGFNFWRFLPDMFYFVQFPYRLLMFVTLFGALLLGWSLAQWTPRWMPNSTRGRKWLAGSAIAIALLFVAAPARTYVVQRPELDPGIIKELIRKPNLGGNGALVIYLRRPEVAMATTQFHPDLNYAGVEFGGVMDGFLYEELGPIWMLLPPAGWQLEMTGEVIAPRANDDVVFTARLGDQTLTAISCKPSTFHLHWPMSANPSSKPTPFYVHAEQPVPAGAASIGSASITAVQVKPSQIRFVPPAGFVSQSQPLVTAASLGAKVKRRKDLRATITLTQASLVQLPVLDYPGLQQVLDNGQPVATETVGRFIAVRLGPGSHEIKVAYIGSKLANAISGIGWTGVLTCVVVCGWRARRRDVTRADQHRTRSHARSPGTLGYGLTSIAVASVVVGPALSPGIEAWIDRRLHPQPLCRYAATRVYSPSHGPELAFDQRPESAWVVAGDAPATLTLTPEKPAALIKIELEARRTALFEAWNTVRVDQYLNNMVVATHTFTLAGAHANPVTTINLPKVTADRVEMTFSDPVQLFPDGVTRATVVNPGYSEIRLSWR